MKPLEAQRVLVVGVGGLGCPASLMLAKAGVGAVTLLDADRVELSNLPRQPWHHAADVGRPKVESAATKLRRSFPRLKVEAREERLEAGNAEGLFLGHDWIVDGTDSVATKYLLSDTSVQTGTPVVYGGVVQWAGQAMLVQRGGPCLRCLFDVVPQEDELPTCSGSGVLGSLAGVIGGLQVRLALSEMGAATPGEAKLVRVDGSRMLCRVSRVARNPECAACCTNAVFHASGVGAG